MSEFGLSSIAVDVMELKQKLEEMQKKLDELHAYVHRPCEYELRPFSAGQSSIATMLPWCKTHGWYCPGNNK